MSGCVHVGIIGGGVAGGAAIYGLDDELRTGRVCVTLFEMNSNLGGRATSRQALEPVLRVVDLFEEVHEANPHLWFNHGASDFYAATSPFAALSEHLADQVAKPQPASCTCASQLHLSLPTHMATSL